jgi:competence ComEA-like helix-hairpin-helix protein
MGLLDRDYMRRSPSRWSWPSWIGSAWLKYLWIVALVIGLATAGLYVYKDIRAELVPGKGDLIVNVNTATQAELETIPGIGPVLARGIIKYRHYDCVYDLERVPGIGHYTFNKIRPYVKVDGETENRRITSCSAIAAGESIPPPRLSESWLRRASILC